MRRMSKKLSRKADKKKSSISAAPDGLASNSWQGERLSALDGLYGGLALGGENKTQQRENSPKLRERRYVREMVVASDDMLSGPSRTKNKRTVERAAVTLHSVSDVPETELPTLLADAQAAGVELRGKSVTTSESNSSFSEQVDDRTPMVAPPDLFPALPAAELVKTQEAVPQDDAKEDSGKKPIAEDKASLMSDVFSPVSKTGIDSFSGSCTPDLDSSFTRDNTSDTSSMVSASTNHSQDSEVVQRLLERVMQLERRNQQLASDVDRLTGEQKATEEMKVIADDALSKWKSVEAASKHEIRTLSGKLSNVEVHAASLEKQNEDLTEQLRKSISSNASLKQQLFALGETVSRSSSPAWCPSPRPGGGLGGGDSEPPDAASLASSELETAREEIMELHDQRETLSKEIAQSKEDSDTRICQLEKDVKAARDEQRLAERQSQRYQEQNEQLLREKATLERERILSRAATPVASPSTSSNVRTKQLESALQFVGEQLPALSTSGRRPSDSDGIDLTSIRKQVLSAKQQLSAEERATVSLTTAKKQVKQLQDELQVQCNARESVRSELQSKLQEAEKKLSAKCDDLAALDNQMNAAVAEKEEAEKRIAEVQAENKTLSAGQSPNNQQQQQVASLRQERAQLRLEVRQLQKQDKTHQATVTELEQKNCKLQSALDNTEEKLNAVTQSYQDKLCAYEVESNANAEEKLQDEELVASLRAQCQRLEAELKDSRQTERITFEENSEKQSRLASLQISHDNALKEQDGLQVKLVSLQDEVGSLSERNRLINLHNDALQEELSALQYTQRTSNVDEIVQAEKDKMSEALHSMKEQLNDRGTMVRELKHKNEQLHEKIQQETKRVRELTDAVDSAQQQTYQKDRELLTAQNELKEINAAIDEMEELPRANRRLQEEIQALRQENEVLKASQFNSAGTRHLEGSELEEAYRQTEWRLLQLEPQQEKWRHDREELEQLRVFKQRQESLLSDATEEVSMLRLHNQQIRVLQEQFKSKSNEVSYLEEENRQLQRELREVELEVTVWKEKTNRYQEERQSLLEEQRRHARTQHGQGGGDSHHRHVQALQERICKLEEERSVLASRAVEGAQRQQRLSAQVESLESVVTDNHTLTARVSELKRCLEKLELEHLPSVNGSPGIDKTKSPPVLENGYNSAVQNGQSTSNFDIGSSSLNREVVVNGVPAGKIPDGFDLMADFTGTDRVSQDVQQLCQDFMTSDWSDGKAKPLKKYWFGLTDSADAIDPQVLGELLRYLMKSSEELLRRVLGFTDSNGNTALHYLLFRGQLLAAWLVLQTGECKVDGRNAVGYTCCMMLSAAPPAKISQHQFVVDRLFELADIDLQAAQDGQTALMLAVGKSNRVMVEMLLKANCRVNMKDMDGSTALMFASELGEEEIVRLILARDDVDLDIKDRGGNGALQIALEKNRRDVAVLLYAALVYRHRGNTDQDTLAD